MRTENGRVKNIEYNDVKLDKNENSGSKLIDDYVSKVICVIHENVNYEYEHIDNDDNVVYDNIKLKLLTVVLMVNLTMLSVVILVMLRY